MSNSNEPASTFEYYNEFNALVVDKGLTKREHFAIMAMQGILSTAENMNNIAVRGTTLTKEAVVLADALLKELEKTNVQ